MNPEPATISKRQFLCFLALALVLVPIAAYSQEYEAGDQSPDPRVAGLLIRAEAHHDLAVLYIDKGELEKGIAEARHIIQLQLPAQYEKCVAQSLSIITEALADMRQFDLAQSLLDESLETIKHPPNQVKIYRTKARLYMLAGDNDRAIESWQKALDLEPKSVP
jgi:tetratricopeptide (TPR) repeat protein